MEVMELQLAFEQIGNAINWLAPANIKYKDQYIVQESKEGKRRALKIFGDYTCKFVKTEEIVSAMTDFLHTHDIENKEFLLSHVTKCANTWIRDSVPMTKIPDFLFQDQPGLCFYRLPWKYEEDGVYPKFNEIVEFLKANNLNMNQHGECENKPTLHLFDLMRWGNLEVEYLNQFLIEKTGTTIYPKFSYDPKIQRVNDLESEFRHL